MIERIILAGFGGQGILLAGKLVIRTGMEKGLNVTYIPSYGAEVRGGTAHCQVIVSEETIASPIIISPDAVLAMNTPSLIKFEKRPRPGGILILNSSLVKVPCRREDLRILAVPATRLAEEAGAVKAANMVMLGALLRHSKLLSLADMAAVLPGFLPARHRDLLEINLRALETGHELAG